MTKEGEVMVKSGFNDTNLVDGMRSASSKIAGWAKGVKHEFQGITQVAKVMKLAMKGFGFLGIITVAEHIYEIVSGLFKANDEVQKFAEWIDKARESADKIVEKLRELRIGNMAPAEQLDERKEDLRKAKREEDADKAAIDNKKKEIEELQKVQDGEAEQHYYFTQAQDTIKAKSKEIIDLETKHLEAKAKTLEATKKVGDAQKAINEERKKADAEQDKELAADAAEEQKRHMELHRLYMFHLNIEKAKKDEVDAQANMLFAARSQFGPSHDQVIQSGTVRRGRFRPSYSSGLQQDIDDETSGFQNDIAKFGYDGAGGDQRRIGIESMQKELSDFLHGKGFKTNEEKMLEAQQKSQAHLKDIRDVFYNVEPEAK